MMAETQTVNESRLPEADIRHAWLEGTLQVDLDCIQRQALALVDGHGPPELQR